MLQWSYLRWWCRVEYGKKQRGSTVEQEENARGWRELYGMVKGDSKEGNE